MFNEATTVERMVLVTLYGGTPADMVVDNNMKNIYPQISQINADSNPIYNLRTSAKSADKKGTAHV